MICIPLMIRYEAKMNDNLAIAVLLYSIEDMREEVIELLQNNNVDDKIILDVIVIFYNYLKININTRGNNDESTRND